VNDEAVGELAHMPECGRSTPKTPAPTPQADRADFGAGLGGIESELVQMTVSSGRSIYGSLVRRPGISQRIGVTGPPRMIARSTFGTQVPSSNRASRPNAPPGRAPTLSPAASSPTTGSGGTPTDPHSRPAGTEVGGQSERDAVIGVR
jgi:hypothetical protein